MHLQYSIVVTANTIQVHISKIQECWKFEIIYFPIVLATCQILKRALFLVPGSTTKEGHGELGESSEEDHKDD